MAANPSRKFPDAANITSCYRSEADLVGWDASCSLPMVKQEVRQLPSVLMCDEVLHMKLLASILRPMK